MSGFRCYSPELGNRSEEVELSPFESHHLVATNRAKVGNRAVVFDGNGIEWVAEIKQADRKQAVLRCLEAVSCPRPSPRITLALALLKGKAFDGCLRQSAEMGVYQIQPLLTERTEVRIKNTTSKYKKWQLQLIEGCKQSGNPWLPQINNPLGIADYLQIGLKGMAVVASLEENRAPEYPFSRDAEQTVFIGPEGDFSEKEYLQLRKAGAKAIRLGPYVLRAETAVVAAIALVSAQKPT